MAAVTILSTSPPNVKGNQRELYYNLTIATGQQLQTPLKKILSVVTDQPGNITVQAETAGLITFTGNATAVNVCVTGH